MKFSSYYKDGHIFAALTSGLFLNIVIWSLLSWRLFPLQDQLIILHYNVYFGTDQIGPPWQASYIPAIGLAIILVNFFTAYLLWEKHKTTSHILNYLSVFLQILLLVTAVLIILVNL